MSRGRKRTPYERKGIWVDASTELWDQEDGFEKHVDIKIDLHRAILRLPSMQRIAVLKRLRDEKLTHAEEEALSQAKRGLRKWLK